jgi:hypothetical protein
VDSQAVNVSIVVWRLESATTGFPFGCPHLVLTPGTMGMDTYKIAVATLTAARIANRSLRFYAHGVRDGGCGVDYVELV